jgi:hypothetical protein
VVAAPTVMSEAGAGTRQGPSSCGVRCAVRPAVPPVVRAWPRPTSWAVCVTRSWAGLRPAPHVSGELHGYRRGTGQARIEGQQRGAERLGTRDVEPITQGDGLPQLPRSLDQRRDRKTFNRKLGQAVERPSDPGSFCIAGPYQSPQRGQHLGIEVGGCRERGSTHPGCDRIHGAIGAAPRPRPMRQPRGAVRSHDVDVLAAFLDQGDAVRSFAGQWRVSSHLVEPLLRGRQGSVAAQDLDPPAPKSTTASSLRRARPGGKPSAASTATATAGRVGVDGSLPSRRLGDL